MNFFRSLRRFAQPFFAAARRAALVPFRTCERLPRLRFASITWPETRRRLWRRRDSVATGAASRVLCLRRLRRFASVATGAASRVLCLRRLRRFASVATGAASRVLRLRRRFASVATGAASRVLRLRRRFASVATGAASRVLRLRRVTFFFANFPEAERWRLRLAGISFSFL